MQYCSLLIVDLFSLFVADQQQNGSDKEYGRTPTHAVRPAEVPERPIGRNQVWVMQLVIEKGRI